MAKKSKTIKWIDFEKLSIGIVAVFFIFGVFIACASVVNAMVRVLVNY